MRAQFLNLSGYKFVPLENLPELKQSLLSLCSRLNVIGTILISPEGINAFVAGDPKNVASFQKEIAKINPFHDLAFKESYSETVSFRRMFVKIKKEIIAFGVDSVKPYQKTSRRIKAEELKKWLDEGRDFLLLDTRNDYEVRIGTFEKADHLHITHFKEFPEKCETLLERYQDKPVVTFCTGGVRCEKAGPFMEEIGFKDVYQLDGGILKYFEECGGDHWKGDCFVFDKRVALDPSLTETYMPQCYACRQPLFEEDLKSIHYKEGASCPYCKGQPVPSGRPCAPTQAV